MFYFFFPLGNSYDKLCSTVSHVCARVCMCADVCTKSIRDHGPGCKGFLYIKI